MFSSSFPLRQLPSEAPRACGSKQDLIRSSQRHMEELQPFKASLYSSEDKLLRYASTDCRVTVHRPDVLWVQPEYVKSLGKVYIMSMFEHRMCVRVCV